MKPESLQSARGSNLWQTPIPYLFGGLGAMMILIAIALVVLACSHRDSSDDDRDPEAPNSVEKPAILPLDMEPRIAVIMAGDDKPTFLAKPVSSIQHAQQRASYCPSSCDLKQNS